MRRPRTPFLLLCVALALVAGACGSSPETRMYILDSTAPAASTRAPELAIGVGPITFPPYLNRPEMVSMTDGNSLDLAEFDQWAEALEDGFTRVLTEDLAALTGTDRIEGFPWSSPDAPDRTVAVDVSRFDARAAGGVKLVARWTVRGPGGKTLVPRRKSVIEEKSGRGGQGGTAAALSRAIGKLAAEIAAAMAGLPKP